MRARWFVYAAVPAVYTLVPLAVPVSPPSLFAVCGCLALMASSLAVAGAASERRGLPPVLSAALGSVLWAPTLYALASAAPVSRLRLCLSVVNGFLAAPTALLVLFLLEHRRWTVREAAGVGVFTAAMWVLGVFLLGWSA